MTSKLKPVVHSLDEQMLQARMVIEKGLDDDEFAKQSLVNVDASTVVTVFDIFFTHFRSSMAKFYDGQRRSDKIKLDYHDRHVESIMIALGEILACYNTRYDLLHENGSSSIMVHGSDVALVKLTASDDFNIKLRIHPID